LGFMHAKTRSQLRLWALQCVGSIRAILGLSLSRTLTLSLYDPPLDDGSKIDALDPTAPQRRGFDVLAPSPSPPHPIPHV
jgi:hypothetical protein